MNISDNGGQVAAQSLQVAQINLVKKGMDQAGEQALQLVEASVQAAPQAPAEPHLGNHLDVTA